MNFKQYGRQERWILGIALAACFALLYLLYDDSLITDSFTDGGTEAIGRIKTTKGDVRHKANRDFQWKNAKADRQLRWGDGVFTGPQSSTQLELTSGGSLELDANSLVILTPSQNEMRLELKFGQFRGDLAGKDLQVQMGGETLTLSGSGSQGSQVELGRDASKKLVVNVVKGNVALKSKTGPERNLAAGRKAEISVDGKSVTEVASTGSILRSTASSAASKSGSGAGRAGRGGKTSAGDASGPDATTGTDPSNTSQQVASTDSDQTVKPVLPRNLWQDPSPQIKVEVPLDENDQPTKNMELPLAWKVNSKSEKTLVEISKTENFDDVVFSDVVEGTSLNYPADEGTYFVRTKPAESFETEWSPVKRVELQKKPMPPLDAPKLATTQSVIDPTVSNSGSLAWEKVPRATKYRVEYSNAPEFTKVISSTETSDSQIGFTVSRPGRTYYRVTALNPQGKASTPSEIGTVVVPQREVRLSPTESKEVLGMRPNDPPTTIEVPVSWTRLKTAAQYQVQVSKSKDFRKVEKNLVLPENSGAVPVQQPGEYHVRVRPLDKEGKPNGPFSNSQSFTYVYKVPLAQPVLVEPKSNITMFFQDSKGPFWLTWKRVRQAEQYYVEIGTDPTFKSKIVSLQTTSNRQLVNQDLPPGQLYWRVKATNPEKESQWSESRPFKVFSGRRAGEE